MLVRRAGGLHRTAAGEQLKRQARSLLSEAAEMEQTARLTVQGEAGILQVGFGVAVLARGLPEVILRFRHSYPAITLFVKNMSTADQLQALRDRSIDLGFVRLPMSAADIETVPFVTERLMIVLGKDHLDTPDGLAGLRENPSLSLAVPTYQFLRSCVSHLSSGGLCANGGAGNGCVLYGSQSSPCRPWGQHRA